MKRTTLTFALLLGVLAHLAMAQDAFRTAALESIRQAAPEVNPAQIRLLAAPMLTGQLRSVAITSARFERTLRVWQVYLNCEPRTACMTTLATVESQNEYLFPRQGSFRKQLLIQAGERKQLTQEDEFMRLTVPVTCLQTGAAGDQIRVRETNSGRILFALVKADGSIVLRSSK